MEPMKVICFYWEGERWQATPDITNSTDPQYRRMLERTGGASLKLVSQYVNNLYQGVKRFANRPFDFICFTNEPLAVGEGIELRAFPLVTQRGVLPRVYMFSSDAGLGNGQVLCLDLDVVIVGDLSRLMDYEGSFCARSKFKQGEEYKLDGDIMSFRAGPETEARFWKPFIADVARAVAQTQGRERYWVRICANDMADRWDQIAPGSVLSYKRHLGRGKPIPEGAAIVSCHGFPRPHQVTDSWIKTYWHGEIDKRK